MWTGCWPALAGFGRQKASAIEAYKQFIKEGKGQASAWAQLKNQIYLGDEDFVEKMQALIDGEKELSEIPSRQRRGVPKALEYYESMGENRDGGIARAYASGGYSMKAIGKHFGLHYSRVSRIVSGAKVKTCP